MSCTCAVVFDFVNVEMNLSAISCVNMRFASWMDGIKRSIIFSFFSKSSKQYSIISLSDNTPSARITIKRGIGLRTFGITTTICPFEYRAPGATMRTDIVRSGFDASSDTVRISAE